MMLDPRWRKVCSDLWQYRVRTALIVLTVTLGALAVGVVVMINAVLLPDSSEQYRLRNPEQISLNLSQPADDALLAAVRAAPGVARAEPRVEVTTLIQLASGEYGNAMVIAVPPAAEMQINRLSLADGSAPRSDLSVGEIYIERSARGAINVAPGGLVRVKMGGEKISELRLAGYVHDLSVWPYTFEPDVVAYVSSETMAQLVGPGVPGNPRLAITTTHPDAARSELDPLVQSIRQAASQSGAEVESMELFTPADFFAAQSLQIFQMILLGLGLLAALLGATLVINNLTALLDQQIRQIAIMKTIGGTQGQIGGVYLALVLAYGLLAAALAFPIAALGGYQICLAMASLINIDLLGFRFPVEVTLSLALTTIGLPLLAALAPIILGLRLTVREALAHYGVSESAHQVLEWLAARLRFLPNPVALSLRNTFRRRSRLVLTLCALALGGACLIAILNLRSALTDAIDYALQSLNVDVILTLDQPVSADTLEAAARQVKGVETAEGWGFTAAQFYTPGSSSDSRRVLLLAPPLNSKLVPPDVDPHVFSGTNENGMIINKQVLELYPGLKVGDEVQVKVRQKTVKFRILGVYYMVGFPETPSLFVSYAFLNLLLDGPDRVHDLRLGVTAQDVAGQQAAADAVRAQLAQQLEVNITEVNLGAVLEASFTEPIEIILLFLLLMAALVVVVGGLGLTGTIYLNVKERQREIGILRSIGAAHGDVLAMILIEALVMGAVGWLLAVVCSLPITMLMNSVIGNLLVGTPLAFTFDPLGALAWLGGTLVVAIVASVQPALYAARLTVREVLAYE